MCARRMSAEKSNCGEFAIINNLGGISTGWYALWDGYFGIFGRKSLVLLPIAQ